MNFAGFPLFTPTGISVCSLGIALLWFAESPLDGQGEEDRPIVFVAESSPQKKLPPGGESDPFSLVSAAERFFNEGERLEALVLFERAARVLRASSDLDLAVSDPRAMSSQARAHVGLGDHLRRSRRAGEAKWHYTRALTLLKYMERSHGENRELLHGQVTSGLAYTLHSLGETLEAREILSDALRGNLKRSPLSGPARGRALYLLGRLLEEQGDEEEARERFAQCAREFPGSRQGERARRYLSSP